MTIVTHRHHTARYLSLQAKATSALWGNACASRASPRAASHERRAISTTTITISNNPTALRISHPPTGKGDKRVLRECLRQLGLPRAAAREKRAIQFGSRIGKHANVRDFGSGRRANAASAGSVALRELPWAGDGG